MKRAVLLVSVLLLSACHSSHTKDWYVQHDDDRKKRVAECNNDASEAATADCQNALAAAAEIFVFGKGGAAKAAR